MASNRHLGRIIALQSIYEFDFRQSIDESFSDIDEIVGRNIDRYKDTVDDLPFVKKLIQGVLEKRVDLNDVIAPIAPDWPIEQIARVDKVALWIALYELQFMDDIPPKVTINEAVELAKSFGGDNSGRFVNGVLGTAYRQLLPEQAAKDDASKKAKKEKQAAKEEDVKETPKEEVNTDDASVGQVSEEKGSSESKSDKEDS